MHENENSPDTEKAGAALIPTAIENHSTISAAAPQSVEMSREDSIRRDLNLATAEVSDNQVKIAYLFAAEHGHLVAFAVGLGWLVHNGHFWVRDENDALVTRRLMRTLRKLKAEGVAEAAAALDGIATRVAKAKAKKAADSQTKSGLESILKIAAKLDGIATKVSDFDSKPHLLNLLNGTLNLITGELQPHDPRDYLTKMTAASYDPAIPATSKLWDDFLNTVLPDPEVRRYLQQMVGVSLWGAVLLHILVILTGHGRNGKGVFYNAVKYALGDYAVVADDGLFEITKNRNANGASPAVAKLLGTRFLVSSELQEKAQLDASFLKRLTGGDPLSARDLYSRLFEFLPAFTAFMVTNFLPKLPANDPAVWARVRVVPWDVVIPEAQQDVHLPEKLKAHADAVLAWAIQGWFDYQANGLVTPAAVQVATQEYADSQDDVRRFIEECCVAAPSNSTAHTTTGLHGAYSEWAQGENIHMAHVLGKTKFGQALTRLGYPGSKSAHGTVHGLVAVARP